MSEFEAKLKLKTVSVHLMSVALAQNTLIEQVQELATREVDGTLSCKSSDLLLEHCSQDNLQHIKHFSEGTPF